MRKVQEASLTSATKHNSRKDIALTTEKWYKNFMIENYENKLISLPDDIEAPIKRITPQKKSNSEAQTQVTPEKPSPEHSSGSEFLVSPESDPKKDSSDDDKFLEPLPVKKLKVEKT